MRRDGKAFNRRQFLSMIGTGAAGVLASRWLTNPLKALADTPPQKPNIVVIMSDDMGYGDIGFHGRPEIPVPHIEALAAESLRFTDGYSTSAVCSPSRAGFITGRCQQRFGMTDNEPGSDANSPELGQTSEKTIADLLKAGGYATGLIGKWHLGTSTGPGVDSHPMAHGFDEFYGFLQAWIDYDLAHVRNAQKILRGRSYDPYRSGNCSRTFGDEGAAFIDRHKSEPFFLFMSFNAPHTTISATAEAMNLFRSTPSSSGQTHVAGQTQYDRMIYDAAIADLDEGVGRVLAKLKELDLEQNTIIFYLNDNGGPSLSDYAPDTFQNFPLRGYKAETWEGGIRVPFMVQWKGHITPGTCREPVISLDIARTALSAAGITPPTVRPLDGVDLLPLLTGQVTSLPQRDLCWSGGGTSCLRRGQYKYMNGGLYNVVSDIGERTNLMYSNMSLYTQLQNAYYAWLSSVTLQG